MLAKPVPSALSSSPHPTPSSPELINPLFDLPEITSLIIDAEIVALDKATGAFRTFQELSNRAKKDVLAADVKVGVGVFAFDLMLLNEVVSLIRSLFSFDSFRVLTWFVLRSPSSTNPSASGATSSEPSSLPSILSPPHPAPPPRSLLSSPTSRALTLPPQKTSLHSLRSA